MRKMTLRSYVELLRLEDLIRSHRFYEKAAHCAIKVYLRLHDKPVTDEDKLKDMITENMTPAELKKLRSKQNKAKRKAEQATKQEQQQQEKKERHSKALKKSTNNGEEELDAPSKDELLPEKLERPEAPLDEAMKFLVPLQLLASKHLMTHVFAFEICFRKRRPLLMLQCVKRAMQVDKEDPKVHGCLVRFQKFVGDNLKELPGPVRDVLDREAKDIFDPKNITASKTNSNFIQKHKKSLPHYAVGVKMLASLDPSKAEKLVESFLNLESFANGVTLECCVEILESLQSGEYISAGESIIEKFTQICNKKFPQALKFQEQVNDAPNNNES